MPQYEYESRLVHLAPWNSEFLKYLNDFGAEGWEVVWIDVARTIHVMYPVTLVILKRRKAEVNDVGP